MAGAQRGLQAERGKKWASPKGPEKVGRNPLLGSKTRNSSSLLRRVCAGPEAACRRPHSPHQGLPAPPVGGSTSTAATCAGTKPRVSLTLRERELEIRGRRRPSGVTLLCRAGHGQSKQTDSLSRLLLVPPPKRRRITYTAAGANTAPRQRIRRVQVPVLRPRVWQAVSLPFPILSPSAHPLSPLTPVFLPIHLHLDYAQPLT